MTRPRLRFAPSPTGYLHVGGARTALFNWLYARGQGGVFILRIEDTDVERSSADLITGILDGLRWLGLDWDEGPGVGGPYGPYLQSERLDRYRAMAQRLVDEGHAYYCYCSPESLKLKRDAFEARGTAWKYDRACSDLTPQRIAELEATGAPRAIRYRVPPGPVRFDDLVHGHIEVEGNQLEEFVVLRSDLQPTYHLSVVVDDLDMKITHVVRGDDHISNTPKQLLLYRAFGAVPPRFAHVPLILGPDKKRLSKRHGATSVLEYQRQGYLPEAMVNFLSLLGWSPGTDREVFSRDELIEAFSLDGITTSNAVFNTEKLDWFNAQHLARMPAEAIADRLTPSLQAAALWHEAFSGHRREWFVQVIELLKPRARKLSDFVEHGQPFFAERVAYDPLAAKKYLSAPGLAEHMASLQEAWSALDRFEPQDLEMALRQVADARGIKAATLIHAARLAMTGRPVSPDLFRVIALLGREQTMTRLSALHRSLNSSAGPMTR